ncbi:ABC transporter substrate-binding protein [Paenibacillus sp. L3-i20]|uniref:ABC transporter substrate-binding protein n=1 Tax=Paenibacillus sp. L3-i20 TaxID=2905833 RepID=UPI001EDE25F4|nr:ABC transporter substrate-binding protein [Paenibacillus sp. L3-i20]GKU76522.1 ferrichrome ABC transporter substrate-binding protein [Paenibacillus sp. L3-i20]
MVAFARTRKILWSGMVGLLIAVTVLTGCGNSGEKQTEGSTNKGNAVSTETTATAENAEKSETRVVKDFFGDVKIPAKPQRIAAIYLEDYLAALGVEPIVQWYHPMWGKQEYLKLSVPQYDITGSIESLLEAKPDLIISDGYASPEIYEKYSKVAPTYRLTDEDVGGGASAILRTIGDLVGESEKAEQLIKDYDQKVADMKSKLQAKIGTESVAVIRLNIGEKDLNILGIKNKFVGSILYKELGLTPPKLVAEMEKFIDTISMEVIPNLGADHIIVLTSNGSWSSPENKESIDNLLNDPLWKTNSAVKNGNVYFVERTYWQTGAFTANQLKMEDLEKHLLQ